MTVPWIERLSFQNPVLSKDVRTRMRGGRAFLIQGAYVAILVLMIGVAYFGWWIANRAGASPMVIASRVGRLFYGLVFQTQAALVVLITPALTGGAITIEREQRTYDLLACTRLSARTIIVGKLLSTWLFVVMLLTCSLPMAALCLMFGGVSLGEIAASYLMLCLFALAYASLGLLCSTVLARSVSAIILAYGLIFGSLVGSTMLDLGMSGLGRALNPFGCLATGADPITIFSHSLPAWLPGAIVRPLLSLLFTNWAISRLPHFHADRALVIRSLVALLLIVCLLLALGVPLMPYYFVTGQLVVIGAAVALILSALLFATADSPTARPRSLLAWMITGLDPRRMFSSQLRGGWSYLLLLAALYAGTVWLAIVLRAQAGSGSPGPYRPGAGPYSGYQHLTLSQMDALRLFLLMAAVLLCYSGLGALGAALRSRRVGIVLAAFFLLVSQGVVGMVWIGDLPPVGSVNAGTDYSLYLAPYVGVFSIADPAGAKRAIPAGMLPPAALPVWQVTAAIYLLLALAFLASAEAIYQANYRRVAPAQPEPAGPAGG